MLNQFSIFYSFLVGAFILCCMTVIMAGLVPCKGIVTDVNYLAGGVDLFDNMLSYDS